jgi:uncharacterized delta-60 repeat protein
MMAKFNPSGVLDTSFIGGTVFNSVPTRVSSTRQGFFLFTGLSASNVTSSNDQLFEIFVKDNFIYGVGQYWNNSHFDIGVLKVSTITGSVDTSFSSAGVAGPGLYIHTGVSSTDIGQDLSVLKNGKVIVVGAIGGADNLASSRNMAALRLNINGTLDLTFGSSGVFTHGGAATNGTINKEDTATTLSILPSGKIVIGGYSNKSDGTSSIGLPSSGNNNFDLTVWKLNENGSFDTTFNSVGYLTKGISEFYANSNSGDWSNVGFGADFVSDLIVINNKIFGAGSVYYGRTEIGTDGILFRID